MLKKVLSKLLGSVLSSNKHHYGRGYKSRSSSDGGYYQGYNRKHDSYGHGHYKPKRRYGRSSS